MIKIKLFSNKRLINMIITCYLPISIVEKRGFIDYTECLEPSFKLPSRNTIKNSKLPNIRVSNDGK